MRHHGKRLEKDYQGIDREAAYKLDEAIDLLKERANAKFDETLEIAMNLSVDPRKADQNLRGAVSLPHGTGKVLTVLVFAKDAKVEEAKKAGADIVGGEELIEKIQNGFMEFDKCISTPDMMIHVGKLGKVLGPRGLMPNPKIGTVTNDVAKAVEAVKGGQVEYRTDKAGIIHAGIGKMSFAKPALQENIEAFIQAIVKARPSGVKGTFIKRLSLSSTMGIGLKVEPLAQKGA